MKVHYSIWAKLQYFVTVSISVTILVCTEGETLMSLITVLAEFSIILVTQAVRICKSQASRKAQFEAQLHTSYTHHMWLYW